MKKHFILIATAVVIYSCGGNKSVNTADNKVIQDSAQIFLDTYSKKYQELSIVSNETQWKSNSRSRHYPGTARTRRLRHIRMRRSQRQTRKNRSEAPAWRVR